MECKQSLPADGRLLFMTATHWGIAQWVSPRLRMFVQALSAVFTLVLASLEIVALLAAFLLMVPGGAILLAVLYLQRKVKHHVSP
jgi:hypothetical protein